MNFFIYLFYLKVGVAMSDVLTALNITIGIMAALH